MAIEFDKTIHKGRVYYIDRLYRLLEKLVKAHNELEVQVKILKNCNSDIINTVNNTMKEYFIHNFGETPKELADNIVALKESAATQAQEIAKLRRLIKQDVELLEADNREIRAKLDNKVAIPATGSTALAIERSNLEKKIKQMREDIRAFVGFVGDNYDVSNILSTIGHLVNTKQYKNLKRHCDD